MLDTDPTWCNQRVNDFRDIIDTIYLFQNISNYIYGQNFWATTVCIFLFPGEFQKVLEPNSKQSWAINVVKGKSVLQGDF